MANKNDGKVTKIGAKSRDIDAKGLKTLVAPLQNPSPAPQHLPVKTALYWNDLAKILVARQTLTAADLGTLELLCVLFERAQRLRCCRHAR